MNKRQRKKIKKKALRSWTTPWYDVPENLKRTTNEWWRSVHNEGTVITLETIRGLMDGAE